MTADFGVSCGHTEYSNIRFEDGTQHMVIFEAAHDLPELEGFRLELPIPYRNMAYRVRLFLTDAEYRNIRLWAAADKVRILHHRICSYRLTIGHHSHTDPYSCSTTLYRQLH